MFETKRCAHSCYTRNERWNLTQREWRKENNAHVVKCIQKVLSRQLELHQDFWSKAEDGREGVRDAVWEALKSVDRELEEMSIGPESQIPQSLYMYLLKDCDKSISRKEQTFKRINQIYCRAASHCSLSVFDFYDRYLHVFESHRTCLWALQCITLCLSR